MAQWYYLVDGQEVGPLEGSDLKRLAASGQLRPDDKVRRADMVEIHQASQIKGLFQTTANPSAPATATTTAPAVTATNSGGGTYGPTTTKKRIIPALLLAIFLGGLGAHRFYAERKRSANMLLLMTIFGFGATFFGSFGGLSEEDALASLTTDKERTNKQVLAEFAKEDSSPEGSARLNAVLRQSRLLDERIMELHTQADKASVKGNLWILIGQALLLGVGVWILADVISLISGSFKDGNGVTINEWT